MDIRNHTPTNWRNKKARKTRKPHEHSKVGKRNKQIWLGYFKHHKTIYRIEDMLNIKKLIEINEKVIKLWEQFQKSTKN
nr:MAG TPA: hypothetical protein [Microviridae sp.]